MKSFLRRPPVIVITLALAAIVAFSFVTHLVNRFREQQKALARHLFAQGQTELDSGRPAEAVDYFRAALSYNRDDFEYQLNLARALRDSGLADESKSYLMNLWERAPEDGFVNLALGRLVARQGSINEAVHYYHNAVYGTWVSDADSRRRNAQFELVNFLLGQNDRPRADAELMTLAASLPDDSDLQIRIGQMFEQAGDHEHALSEYQLVGRHDAENAAALAGAGEAAFQLRRYDAAERDLSNAMRLGPLSDTSATHLQTSRSVIAADAFTRTISESERKRRVKAAFERAGARMHDCAPAQEISGQSELASLEQQWLALKPGISRSRGPIDGDTLAKAMEIVFQIEHATQSCRPLTEFDQALLLLSQDNDGARQ